MLCNVVCLQICLEIRRTLLIYCDAVYKLKRHEIHINIFMSKMCLMSIVVVFKPTYSTGKLYLVCFIFLTDGYHKSGNLPFIHVENDSWWRHNRTTMVDEIRNFSKPVVLHVEVNLILFKILSFKESNTKLF